MPSRRNYLTITFIMLVLFFLFQTTGVMKDQWNEYDKNEYSDSAASKLDGTGNYKSTTSDACLEEEPFVIFIGDSRHTGIGRTVTQWCTYTKLAIVSYTQISDIPWEQLKQPVLLVLDAKYLDFAVDTEQLLALTELGISMVFCNLPDVTVIEHNLQLQKLLGIQHVRMEEVTLDGIDLYEDFLLGGRSIYEVDTDADEEEKERQDLNLQVPWYVTRACTKTYMCGRVDKDAYAMEGEELKNESLPSLIWRNSINEAMVFAVNGNYMEDNTGYGILSAILYELNDYSIYPVVNAQNFVVSNFAALSSEQDEEMQSRYSRSQKAVLQDVVWPSLVSIVEKSGDKLTVVMNPKLDYTSEEEPDADRLVYYLKLFRENNAENALCLFTVSGTRLTQKINYDAAFFEENIPDYEMRVLYVDRTNEQSYPSIYLARCLETVCTVCMDMDASEAPVSYIKRNITRQRATHNGYAHTFSDNLRLKSLETTLGYSCILTDFQTLLYPQSDEDGWEKLSDDLSRNTVTYWKPFLAFEKTTLSESDKRVRQFLSLTYTKKRTENTITLQLEGLEEEAYFILRIHNEEIDEIEGGSFTKIEEHAYLITAAEKQVEITLKAAHTLRYHYDQ